MLAVKKAGRKGNNDKKLLFVDANIWLDFYRARNEMGLRLLGRLDAVVSAMIVSYQLESEFRRNRQRVIEIGMNELKAPDPISSLGIFSDAKATKMIDRHASEIRKLTAKLKNRLTRALEHPIRHDPVYKACQRIFRKDDTLNLKPEAASRHGLRQRAWRRFIHGYPPRKPDDTSFGDAINWEWMIQCATEEQASVVIVSRDSDYGVTLARKSYVTDQLRHEFADRVGRRRKVLLFSRLSEALKLFDVAVSPQEEQAETDLVSNAIAARPLDDWEPIHPTLLGDRYVCCKPDDRYL